MANNNDNKVLNVPPLRFPEFSGEWKMCTIGELITKVGSGVTPRGGEAVYKTEGHPFVRSQNVGLGNLLLDDIAFIDEETHLRQKNTELQFNDVLLNITGASIGRSALVDKQIVGGNVNQHVCIIRTKENLIPSFICSFLLSNYGQRQIDSFQAGGNRQGLNFEQIKSIKITIPSKDEQIKIAKLLRAIDERIATQNKIIEKLQSLIKGLRVCCMQRNGSNNVYLSEIAQIYVSIRPTTGIKPLYTTIATVTMNLIVSAAIVLLNPYVTVYISYKIPPFALSVHIPDVSTSIYVEVDSKVLLGLPFCDKASGQLHHSGTPLGLHRVPYR